MTYTDNSREVERFDEAPRKSKKIDNSALYNSIILSIIGFGALLRFFMLTNQSLWYDEGISLVISDGVSLQDNLERILNRRGGDKYQPLYYLVLFAWRSLAGDSEFALRTLSVLLGIATAVLIFLFTQHVFGKRHALWSTLLISSSSFCIYYSQEVRAYSLQLFLAALQLYFFRKALTSEKVDLPSRIGFSLTTAINFFGGILLVLFSIAICTAQLLTFRKIKNWFSWWLPTAVVSMPVVAYYLFTPAASNPTKDATNALGLPIIKNAVFTAYGLLVGITYGPPLDALRGDSKLQQVLLTYWPGFLALALVLVGIGFSLIVYMWRFSKDSQYHKSDCFFITLLITSLALAALFAAGTKINWLPRHSFYIYLPICILLPTLIGRGFQHNQSKQKYFLFSRISRIALIGLIALNLYSACNYFFDEAHWRDDYRSTAQYLLENRQPSEKSILLWGTTRLLSYYGDSQTIDGTKIPRKQLVENVERLTNNSSTVIIVVNREFLWSRKEPKTVEEKMGVSYKLASKAFFKNFSIYRFAKV